MRPLSRVTAAAVAAALGFSAAAHAQLSVQTVVSGLTAPMFLDSPPGDSRLFVLERAGRIRIVSGGVAQPGSWLDISGDIDARGEGGLLGLAFSPDFANDGTFYLNYTTTAASPVNMHTVVERFVVSNPGGADPGTVTRETIIRIPQPFTNHNAGWIGFKPGDATHLYIPTGDGGSGNDPLNHGQNPGTLLGGVMRLDITGDDFPADPDRNYRIPTDNFFNDGDPNTRGELIAYGLRNPWRNSFDRLTGDLYIGDVGQDTREEISRLDSGVQGQNFGWRLREGFIATPTPPGNPVGGPEPPDHVPPLVDYAHQSVWTSGGRGSVTGGYVYRGSWLGSEWQGIYFFGDFVAGRFYTIDPSAPDIPATMTDITDMLFPGGFGGFRMVSFGEDASGELYIIDMTGTIHRLIPEPGTLGLLGPLALLALRRRR